jgi:poly-gamma-glutamate synthesis protein (capsule biosynthesis protein)
LKWAGFDMMAHSNNHTFDYGTSGVLETIQHAEGAGLTIAGSGKDLQSARAPRYRQCNGGTVALVAMASDFPRMGQASKSRPDLQGRPALNPLTVSSKQITLWRSGSANRLENRMPRLGDLLNFQLTLSWGARLSAKDQRANLDAISEAASNADIVVASVHAHSQGQWLTEFAHQAIERGASMVFVHGPHHVRGIEIYRGSPIFYSMGNFVFEPEFVARHPVEAYEKAGIAHDAPMSELMAVRDKLTKGLSGDRTAYEGFVTVLSCENGKVKSIRLLPIDLQFDGADDRRGRPRLASGELGRRIIDGVAMRSKRLGTRLRYVPEQGFGELVPS